MNALDGILVQLSLREISNLCQMPCHRTSNALSTSGRVRWIYESTRNDLIWTFNFTTQGRISSIEMVESVFFKPHPNILLLLVIFLVVHLLTLGAP